MPRYDLTEEEAEALFAEQLRAIAAEGAAPDCAERLAAIIAENEAECLRLEQAVGGTDDDEQERHSVIGR